MEFSRQEYWNGLPFPSPGDLPDPDIEPRAPDSLPCEPPGTTLQRKYCYYSNFTVQEAENQREFL